MVTGTRVRGMNAALASGEAGVGEMRPAKAPLRPRQLIIALVLAGGGVAAAGLTYRALASPAPTFVGHTTPGHAYYLNFAADGTLQSLDVHPGQVVKAGQVLATEDSTVAAADLKAAQAEVDADTATVSAQENPQTGVAQQNQAQVLVTKATGAVNSAQSALSAAQQSSKNSIDVQAAVVAGRQKVLDADTARYTSACSAPLPAAAVPLPTAAAVPLPTASAVPLRTAAAAFDQSTVSLPAPPPSPTDGSGPTTVTDPPTTSTEVTASSAPTPSRTPAVSHQPSASPSSSRPPSSPATPSDAAFCQGLQAQITKDGTALTDAQAQLTATQSSASSQVGRDADQLAQSQALLQVVQGQAAAGAAPVAAATIAQAKSELAAAQAKVAQDQRALAAATIIAPADGTVADTAAAVGDQVHPDGIRLYPGPAGQPGTAADQQGGFQLFAPQATPGGNAGSQTGSYAPLITVYSGPMTVTAQLPEASIGDVHTGQAVSVTVTAVNTVMPGTVGKIILDPARMPGAVYYDVEIDLTDPPGKVMPGMTVNVDLKD